MWGFAVKTKDAMTIWKQYRANAASTGLYPLLMSDEHSQFSQLHTVTAPTPPEQILARAASVDAAEWLAQKARGCLEFEGQVRVPDFEVDDSRVQEKDEFQCLALNEHVQWFLVLIPTREPWSVFAYLDYGNWNAYPMAHEHVAIQRYWFDKFGAEPVIVTGDCIEMLVDRPPLSDVESRAVSVEQFAYTAGDLVNQGYGHFGTLARTLRGRKHWFFWWD